MLQLENQTPFAAMMAVLPDANAIDTLYVILKATLQLRPRLALSPVQIPPHTADEYYDDPTASSLKQVSDMHIGKPGTDVLLVGQAWAARQQPVAQSWVTLTVAERRKVVRVSGDRTWRDGVPGAPQPFQSMPLVWERAFGGMQQVRERVEAEERNPIGIGFARGLRTADVEGQPVPNLEDPGAPLEHLGQNPPPSCFAPTSASWLPRRRYAGTYDENWQRRRAPYLPSDFDRRFLNCAAPELTFDRFLQGNEPMEVQGASAEGPLSFTLPPANLVVEVRVAGSVERPPANLETVLVEPDANRLCLTWRAALPCDRKVLKVQKVSIMRVR
jgi:hypothetical protein